MSDTILKEHPKLKGFATHGAFFTRAGEKEATANCPICGKVGKLYVNHTNQAWDCKSCQRHGNLSHFLGYMSEIYAKKLTATAAKELADNRSIKISTLKEFGVGYDGAGTYMIPIVVEGQTIDIRRYQIGGKIFSTPGVHGPMVLRMTKSNKVWVCEGEWDTMAIWEAEFRRHGGNRDKMDGITGVCGAGAFPPKYAPFFQSKEVILAFDNDEAGAQGDKRARKLLNGYTRKVLSVHWPRGTAVGYDARDLYKDTGRKPRKTIATLAKYATSEPRITLADTGASAGAATVGGSGGDTLESNEELTGAGLRREEVLGGYRKWLHLPDDEPLDILYGAIFANRIEGDPIWLFLVGPPGSAKSELLMTLHEAPLIMTTTSLTPQALVSGANFMGSGDPSIIPKLNGKVLVIKDFTTILSMHHTQRDEIFGVLRDAYDGRVEKRFGTGIHRVYDSRFGILAGVTPKIEEFSSMSSVLGERFLKYRIRFQGKIDDAEDQILRALTNIGKQNTMRLKLMDISAKALDRPIMPADIPAVPPEMLKRFIKLAQWVASLRGVVSREKYSGEILFKPVSEVGTRLAQQLTKMAMGVAIHRRLKKVTEAEYRLVTHVARSTAPDRIEEIIKQMWVRRRNDYSTTAEVAEWSRFTRQTVLKLLQDLHLLHVIHSKKGAHGGGMWKLSKKMIQVMEPLRLYADEEAYFARTGRIDPPPPKSKVRTVKNRIVRKGGRKGGCKNKS